MSSIIVVFMMSVIFKWWHYNGYKDGCDGGSRKIPLVMEYRWHLFSQFCISAVGSQNIVFYAQRVWFPPSTIQSFTSHPSGEFYIDSYRTNSERSFERVLPRDGETFLHLYTPMWSKVKLLKAKRTNMWCTGNTSKAIN